MMPFVALVPAVVLVAVLSIQLGRAHVRIADLRTRLQQARDTADRYRTERDGAFREMDAMREEALVCLRRIIDMTDPVTGRTDPLPEGVVDFSAYRGRQ